MNLNGKTALVTGGTDGIGAELVKQLRDKGGTVIVVGRNPERVATTRAAGFEVIAADLSTPQGVRGVVDALGDRPVHLLVNNAGMGVKHNFLSEPPDLDQADRAIFLNLNAPRYRFGRDKIPQAVSRLQAAADRMAGLLWSDAPER